MDQYKPAGQARVLFLSAPKVLYSEDAVHALEPGVDALCPGAIVGRSFHKVSFFRTAAARRRFGRIRPAITTQASYKKAEIYQSDARPSHSKRLSVFHAH